MARRGTGIVAVVVALVASACSGGSNSDPVIATGGAPTTVDEAAIEDEPDDPSTTVDAVADGPLRDVCGDTLVVQTSDFPDVGAGPLYALLGTSPTVDSARQVVSGTLTRADGTAEELTLEVRSGGPAVGFRSPVDLMAQDDSIHLALASTAAIVRDRSSLATRAVMTLTDRSHDALIVDPATYPDVDDLGTLGERSIEVRHVTSAPVILFLEATGVLRSEQLVSGSDGLPATFVGEGGTIAQQGDLSIEPALLPALPQWSRPVVALPASEAGWASLDDMVVADASTDRVSDECLGRFVRVLQQSIVAYVGDPGATNEVMSAVRSEFNPLARLTPELFDAGTQLALEAGVFDTDSDRPAGVISGDGWDGFLSTLAGALDVEVVASDELFDDRFIDRTITR